MEPRRTLYLVDGNNYLFRAYFAIRSLTNGKGLPTNALYGFTSMLVRLVEDENPDYLAVVFDKSEVTFRSRLYPPYKAHRPPPPEDLLIQMPLVRELSNAFGFPTLELDDFEADDIIGTLRQLAIDQPVDVTILSSDKDLMQLIAPGCTMLDTMRNVRYDSDGVVEKMGVRPDQIIDLLALMGDSSDNIPGVPGIGKKTAATLLDTYGSLDGIYAAIDAIKGKRRENLIAHKDNAYLSQKLATIVCDIPMGTSLEDLAPRGPDRAKLTELFTTFNFKGWLRQFGDEASTASHGPIQDLQAGRHDAPKGPALTRDGDTVVRDAAGLSALRASLEAAEVTAFDVLASSSDPREAELVALAFATATQELFYLPLSHRTLDASPQLRLAEVVEALGDYFSNPDRPKVCFDSKTASRLLAAAGVSLEGVSFDTMLASYLLDAGQMRHTRANVAKTWLDHVCIDEVDLMGKGRKRKTLDQVAVSQASAYGCERVQTVFASHARMAPRVAAEQLDELLTTMEQPLAHVLARMEATGVQIDTTYLQSLSDELGERAAELEAKAHDLAGRAFSLGSPKQLSEVLFTELGLKPGKKTRTGYSTDSAVLEKLKDDHELPAIALEWRTLSKLKGTYTDALPQLISPSTGRLHTSFNQAVAATGRLSSERPNLQNIPIRTPTGRRIREAFVAADGSVLISADYSQIELRILAHLCGDARMQAAFADGADIHERTASELFDVKAADVTREQRAMAKTVNFGILYGMSAFRLANEQGISRTEAKEIIEAYFERYPTIRTWKESVLHTGRTTGYVSTLFGRVRNVDDLRAKNGIARSAAERVAVNTPVQGTAADIMKAAMIRVDARLRRELPDARMLLQVHDELLFEAPAAIADDVMTLAREEMVQVIELSVPLEVNAAIGSNWLEAH